MVLSIRENINNKTTLFHPGVPIESKLKNFEEKVQNIIGTNVE